jgi:hypothetical protein
MGVHTDKQATNAKIVANRNMICHADRQKSIIHASGSEPA